jgi:hypothetical protein
MKLLSPVIVLLAPAVIASAIPNSQPSGLTTKLVPRKPTGPGALNVVLTRSDVKSLGETGKTFSWRFFKTTIGTNGRCGQGIRDEVKIDPTPSRALGVSDIRPSGTHKVKIDDKTCYYMNDGTGNSGSLWCNNQEISCKSDPAFNPAIGLFDMNPPWVTCPDEYGVHQLPFMLCEWPSIEAGDRRRSTKALNVALNRLDRHDPMNPGNPGPSFRSFDWNFYETPVGTNAHCGSSKRINQDDKDLPLPDSGRKIPASVADLLPGGEYPLKFDGQDCWYNNSGTNTGVLRCGKESDTDLLQLNCDYEQAQRGNPPVTGTKDPWKVCETGTAKTPASFELPFIFCEDNGPL